MNNLNLNEDGNIIKHNEDLFRELIYNLTNKAQSIFLYLF